mmetsp:Transcript_8047/g.17375  ORF Transcript_8047/g.17375 Transcript_8047/m.17375 type:complete len:205 (+) Transcript_8047:2426-3040(+)
MMEESSASRRRNPPKAHLPVCISRICAGPRPNKQVELVTMIGWDPSAIHRPCRSSKETPLFDLTAFNATSFSREWLNPVRSCPCIVQVIDSSAPSHSKVVDESRILLRMRDNLIPLIQKLPSTRPTLASVPVTTERETTTAVPPGWSHHPCNSAKGTSTAVEAKITREDCSGEHPAMAVFNSARRCSAAAFSSCKRNQAVMSPA